MKTKEQKRREAIARLREARFENSKTFRTLANAGHNLGSDVMNDAETEWNIARQQHISYLEGLA